MGTCSGLLRSPVLASTLRLSSIIWSLKYPSAAPISQMRKWRLAVAPELVREQPASLPFFQGCKQFGIDTIDL